MDSPSARAAAGWLQGGGGQRHRVEVERLRQPADVVEAGFALAALDEAEGRRVDAGKTPHVASGETEGEPSGADRLANCGVGVHAECALCTSGGPVQHAQPKAARTKRGARMVPVVVPGGPTNRIGPFYRRAVGNIERLLNELERDDGLLQKEVAIGSGLSETVFSQKLRGNRSHFYEDEFEDVAEFFRKRTGRPLIGFPHLEWSMMEACDRKVAGWIPRRH